MIVAVSVIVPLPELAENVNVYVSVAPAASDAGRAPFAAVHVIVVVPAASADVQPAGLLDAYVSVGAVFG